MLQTLLTYQHHKLFIAFYISLEASLLWTIVVQLGLYNYYDYNPYFCKLINIDITNYNFYNQFYIPIQTKFSEPSTSTSNYRNQSDKPMS